MDLITLDITDAPASIGPGDAAVLLGDGLTVDDMAEVAGTNGYNILTNLGQRFERRYNRWLKGSWSSQHVQTRSLLHLPELWRGL